MKKQIETLEIKGSRWFQKSYGNTYHTVIITVNGEKFKSGITYGYGNHYLQTAIDMLRENGYQLPVNNMDAYALMLRYPHQVIDVKRMKDL